MSLLDRVKERVASDMSDAEQQAMIDAITAELDARLGPVGPVTVELGDPTDPASSFCRTLRMFPPIDPAQPVTITEIRPGNHGDAVGQTVLEAGDYRLLHGGMTLQRLVTGSHGAAYWAPLVSVSYTPAGINVAARDEATVKLMLLDLSYRGLIKSEKAGDYQWTGSVSADSYISERDAIIHSLSIGSGMLLA